MPRRWRIAPHDEAAVREVSQRLRVSPLLAQILVTRGCNQPGRAEDFLAKKLSSLHDPEQLPGVPAAAERLVDAIQRGRRVTIYGDYDVDGVTATSLLWHCLRLAGGTVEYYIPSRLEEGYGLNCEALKSLHERDPEQLVVTVDCGITSVAEAAFARELGLELIITDHHHYVGELPADTLLVHPRLPGNYPFGELCGVGVAFKLAWAVCARLGDGKKASPRMREFLLSAIGLAAIGTVADVVPLVDENRVLVHYGLASLVERGGPGMRALLKVSGVADLPSLTAENIGYAVGPRINAAGRLGQARLAVELLTTDDTARAIALASYLDELNKNRQTVERKMLKQAKELVAENPAWLESPALVLAHEEWHPGVIGIVAGRVAEHFQRPAVMIAIQATTGIGQGSARTYAGVDLHAALGSASAWLLRYGGHRAAAGLRIERTQLESFREAFCLSVRSTDGDQLAEPELAIDTQVRLSDLNLKAVNELDQLGPFGAKNPRPLLAASPVELAAPPKTMGEGDRHLSLLVRQNRQTFRAVAFGRGEWAEELQQHPGPFSLCFQPMINRFRGQESVELQLVDWQPVGGSEPTNISETVPAIEFPADRALPANRPAGPA